MTMASSSYGERRQLTIVFSDIVGSTELSSQMDPEDWHDIVTQYHQTAASVVKRFEGHVSQYLGDGVLILFGYPKAHENDAEGAIRAGLALLEEIKLLNDTIERDFGKRISVRVGIHTGEVMVRADAGDSGNIFGETPNIAARIQSTAEPDTVCISSTTQRLVAGFFVVEDLGPHILKGVPEPMQIYRVDRPSGVRSRLSAASRSSLTPFVGREDERNLLMNRWTQAQKGKGQLVMITGEAGIGKSRLLQQFKEDLGGIPHTWIEGESSQYEQDTPFAPTLDLVENAFQWTADTPVEKKIDELEQSFSVVGIDPAKSVPLMARLFGFSVPPDRFPPILLSPEQQRVQLLQTLVDWVIGTSHLQPTLLVIEDLHFADPSTLEEFVMLGEQVENAPLMLVFTARPRFKPPWPTRSFHTLINLNRLDHENIREMISGLLGKLIPAETMDALANRTDGNPLFAEELSQSMAEARAVAPAAQQIPSTLNDLLMARLDYLGPVKETAQIGAVLGRAFLYSLLASIAGQPQEELQNTLARLTESGLVFAEKIANETTYTFKHALVQEAAYGSLLKSRRRELHRSAARALNEKFPDVANQRPELVAHHLTEAAELEPAVEAWQKAGDFALARASYAEAERHLTRALKVLELMPDTPERAILELPIQMSLGNAIKVTKGFGAPEAMKIYTRAREISEQLGDSLQFQIILLGLWGAMNSQSQINASRELSNELTRLAERDQNSMMLTWAYETQAIQAYGEGRFADVPPYFEKLCRVYNTEEHTWSPADPKVTTYIHTSLALWQLGLADQARALIHEQAELVKGMVPGNICMGYLGACSLYLHMQEANLLMEHALAMKKMAADNNLPNFISWGSIYEGAASILQGNHQQGIEGLTRGVAEYLATGTHSSLGQYLGYLARGYAGMENMEKALETIEDAFGAAREELMLMPELHRVRGNLLAQRALDNDLEEAEKAYREAIAVSQKFGSLTQELRAVARLGRLLQSCGRGTEARALLAPLYARFTEGFDTSDLRNAKSLLDELTTQTEEK
jgi:class 3 adenylate cyclase/tetratricopeptide (TPR) repeat protein